MKQDTKKNALSALLYIVLAIMIVSVVCISVISVAKKARINGEYPSKSTEMSENTSEESNIQSTSQPEENTTDNTLWCSKEDYVEQQGVDTEYGDTGNNSKGPITALQLLEESTSSWVNVNEQQYILGTTKFNDTDEFTGCDSYSSCSKNTYTMEKRNARARMITIQELNVLGCTATEKSCPIWISNYLKQSTAYGGTTDSE